jgi:golgin subfamily B member 1
MSEQLLRISSLQNRLDEQRLRAEDLHRQGTSDLNIKVHDLQGEVTNLRETLTSRDNQISNLRSFLENSKKVIDRQEVELAAGSHVDRNTYEKLEADLKQKIEDNQRLKEKIKNEMINKLALPDLMETMLAEKNEEIDHLKERMDARDQELRMFKQMGNKEHDDKMSNRTLSDIVSLSEYDEPEQIRKAVECQQMGLPFGSIPVPGLVSFAWNSCS